MDLELTDKTINRFWRSTIKTDTCWIWKGDTTKRPDFDNYPIIRLSNGYGKSKRERAHRFSFRLHKGEIQKGLVIDHICSIRLCVNPDHLRAITQTENMKSRRCKKDMCGECRFKVRNIELACIQARHLNP